MTKRIQKEDANHHMGKFSGYELAGGVYHIAPMYTKQFESLAHRKNGVITMLNAVTKFASDDLAQLSTEGNRVWESLFDDLGLDKDKKWLYSPDGTVKEASPQQTKAEGS